VSLIAELKRRKVFKVGAAYLLEYGYVAYRREKSCPDICRLLGDLDFECGIDVPKEGTK
jgi:hypothetical protein